MIHALSPLRRAGARGLYAVLVGLLGLGSLARAAARPAPTAPDAMVAISEPNAAQAALEILKAGGNAVDAAVAAAYALAVTYPRAGNIGGGGFMLIRTADGESHVIDYRETAPGKSRRDMFLGPEGKPDPGLSLGSYLAVGVPGTVAGMEEARKLAGTMPLGRLMAPAIDLAENGFIVHPRFASAVGKFGKRLREHPSSRRVFLPEGNPPAPGSLFTQPDLARALKLIAREGPDAFYRGPIAKDLGAAMEKNGGIMSLEDLASYRAVIRKPITVGYRGYELLLPPPPSAGGIVLGEMLHMLEPHDLRSLGRGSSAYHHLLAEVMKRAYADRAAFLGDPDHVAIPVDTLLSRKYAASLMAGFDPGKATPAREAGPGNPGRIESESTTHFSIADARGNLVSNTYTLNSSFGMGAVLDGWGFLLNNEMDDFSASPNTPNLYELVGGEANAVAPGKRMLSSMTPTIVLKDGKPFMILGTPGGGRITTMVLQVLLGVVDFGEELQEAVNYPRCHHQWSPDRLSCERGALVADVAAALAARGHEISESSARGDIQAIMFDRERGLILGAADARGYGVAVGR